MKVKRAFQRPEVRSMGSESNQSSQFCEKGKKGFLGGPFRSKNINRHLGGKAVPNPGKGVIKAFLWPKGRRAGEDLQHPRQRSTPRGKGFKLTSWNKRGV